MTKKDYFLKWFLPGLLFIALAFWVGTMKNMVLSFVGFLSFFFIGVALMIEGRRRKSQ